MGHILSILEPTHGTEPEYERHYFYLTSVVYKVHKNCVITVYEYSCHLFASGAVLFLLE